MASLVAIQRHDRAISDSFDSLGARRPVSEVAPKKESERIALVLAAAAIEGLEDLAAGRVASESALNELVERRGSQSSS